MSKAESKALGGLLLIGLAIGGPIYLMKSIGESVGWSRLGAIILVSCATLIGLSIMRSVGRKNRLKSELEARRAALIQKYGDAALVERILSKTIWQGQSEEQLRDSLGAPADVDEKIYKTKTSRTWKYHQLSPKRFALKVMMEDGLVVGWDQKG